MFSAAVIILGINIYVFMSFIFSREFPRPLAAEELGFKRRELMGSSLHENVQKTYVNIHILRLKQTDTKTAQNDIIVNSKTPNVT